ncbi:MAG: molybdopterin-dependent oxidoreductase [Rhodospirillaceae bacterium]|nr:molybdopterin-dependent oxidoreductase [Rhodospirillaceae bacterium]
MIVFNLNGKEAHVECDPMDRLSNILRYQLGLTGTKEGCNAGDCGSCTIILDENLCCSCLIPMGQIEGSDVTTIEGFGDGNVLSTMQQAFLDYGASQCGICIPGMVVSAEWLYRNTVNPKEKDIEDTLGGVLCRCTGYKKIIKCIADVTSQKYKRTAAKNSPKKVIGSRINRLDGAPKVTGAEVFGADKIPMDALRIRVVRSPFNSANFIINKIPEFLEKNPGIIDILTADDIPGENCFGVIPEFSDQPVFAQNATRFVGEAVAAIVGEAKAINEFDLESFPIQWEAQPAVLYPKVATAIGAPRLHVQRTDNILIKGYVASGDTAGAFIDSVHTIENNYETPFIEHAYIEPEAGYAIRDGNRIIIHGCTQAPFMNRESLSRILGLEPESVRVIPTGCGGGFGSKLDLSYQPYIALAAWKLDRPVGIVYSRNESMKTTTKRHPSEISIKVGCDENSRITAIDFHGTFNTGAYASWGPTVANRVPVHASGPYKVPNYLAKSIAVHTNNSPSGAFRGFGVPQAAIALETSLSELAQKANVDELEFRMLNVLRNGDPTVTGQVFDSGVGISKCLQAVRPAWERALRQSKKHNDKPDNYIHKKGVGIATCWYGCGNTSMANPSTIKLGVKPSGQIVLHQGATDIGQGSNTVITQIVADALQTNISSIELVGPDTDLTPDAGKTSASRQTFISGGAALLAGEALREKILRHANVGENAQLKSSPIGLYIEDNGRAHKVDLSRLILDEFGYVLSVQESYDPLTTPLDSNGQGNPYALYGYGAQIAEVTVDIELGTVLIDRMTAAHDVGKAVNPTLIEGQIEGGIAQGIGLALMEEYQPGLTDNLHDYLIPTVGDMPEIDILIVEDPDCTAPNGIKGLGEHVLIPTAPAILNGIRNATGAKINQLPATPVRVLTAIKDVKLKSV